MTPWVALADIGNGLCWAVTAMVIADVFVLRRTYPLVELLVCATGFTGELTALIGTAAQGKPAIFAVLGVVVFGWLLWSNLRKRRKKRRWLKALGAKAKAKLAEMKKKMAERPARPVLRPVPQGSWS